MAEEAQNWMVKRKTPSLEGGLELFQHTSALNKCALELTIEATKLQNQAESAHKAGLKLIISASKPSVTATVTALLPCHQLAPWKTQLISKIPLLLTVQKQLGHLQNNLKLLCKSQLNLGLTFFLFIP